MEINLERIAFSHVEIRRANVGYTVWANGDYCGSFRTRAAAQIALRSLVAAEVVRLDTRRSLGLSIN